MIRRLENVIVPRSIGKSLPKFQDCFFKLLREKYLVRQRGEREVKVR